MFLYTAIRFYSPSLKRHARLTVLDETDISNAKEILEKHSPVINLRSTRVPEMFLLVVDVVFCAGYQHCE
jgi:hypothetical protein